MVLTSSDARTWRQQSKLSQQLVSVAFGRGIFVAVGAENEGTGTILTSTDGGAWTKQDIGLICFLNAVTFNNGIFVAVGGKAGYREESANVILTSLDGITWTERHRGTAHSLNSVTYADGVFVAVGAAPERGGTVFTSDSPNQFHSSDKPTAWKPS